MNEQQEAIRQQRKRELESSILYKITKGLAFVMDRCLLDPLMGIMPGIGDTLTSLTSIPALLMAAFKVRSLPLTLAILYNALMDTLIGMIPLWIGDILDFFYRSNMKNYELIQGFIDDDREVIDEVNGRANKMMILIVIVGVLIYLLASVVEAVWDWVMTLF